MFNLYFTAFKLNLNCEEVNSTAGVKFYINSTPCRGTVSLLPEDLNFFFALTPNFYGSSTITQIIVKNVSVILSLTGLIISSVEYMPASGFLVSFTQPDTCKYSTSSDYNNNSIYQVYLFYFMYLT